MPTLLELTGISKSFAGVHALKGVSFDLLAGEVHALVGENGAGKSTLIKVITGAHLPDEGTIEVQGRPVADLDPVLRAIWESPRFTSSRRCFRTSRSPRTSPSGSSRLAAGAASAGVGGGPGREACSNESARRSTRKPRCARCRCPSSNWSRSRGPWAPKPGS